MPPPRFLKTKKRKKKEKKKEKKTTDLLTKDVCAFKQHMEWSQLHWVLTIKH